MIQSIPAEHFLYIAAILFGLGLVTVMAKRNTVMILMGIELMLNAANINLVTFSYFDKSLQGHFFAIFVIIVAAAETVVALAILMQIYQHFKTANVEKVSSLKG